MKKIFKGIKNYIVNTPKRFKNAWENAKTTTKLTYQSNKMMMDKVCGVDKKNDKK